MLEKPTAGEIIVERRNHYRSQMPADKVRQKMGMVFQSFNLFNHMTVIENLMAAPMDLLVKASRRRTTVDRTVENGWSGR